MGQFEIFDSYKKKSILINFENFFEKIPKITIDLKIINFKNFQNFEKILKFEP